MNNEKNAHELYLEWQGFLADRDYEGAVAHYAKNPELRNEIIIKKDLNGLALITESVLLPAYKELQEIKNSMRKIKEITKNYESPCLQIRNQDIQNTMKALGKKNSKRIQDPEDYSPRGGGGGRI